MSLRLLPIALGLLGMGCGLRSGDVAAANDKPDEPAPGEVRRFELPDDEVVYRAAFSPDGHKVVAAAADGQVWLWDADNGKSAQRLKATSDDLLTGGVLSLAFSPDGKRILFGCADGTVRLWDLTAGNELQTLKGHGGPVWSVLFFKDGKRALSGSTSDYTIREWDLEKGTELRCLKGKERPDSLCLSPDERLLVTTEFKDVRVWDMESGKAWDALEGHRSRVAGAFFSPDGKQIVSASLGEVRVWDVAARKSISKFGDGDLLVEGIALSPDGRQVLLGGTNEMQLWDVQSGMQLKRIEKLSGTVKVVFSPDGRYALSGEMWGRVRLWDLPKSESGKPKE